MTDFDSLLPSSRNRRRQQDSELHILVLHASVHEGREIAGRLAGMSSQEVEFHCTVAETRSELKALVATHNPAALLLDDGAVAPEQLIQMMQNMNELPFLILSEKAGVAEQVEWVHLGAQDVLPASVSGNDLARAIRLAVERKRLNNDLAEALRLEQESLAQMQAVMDQLVGYAARNT